MCTPTKIIEIGGKKIIAAYKQTATGISLRKTKDANTGRTVWLNLKQQSEAKSQI